MFGDNRYRDCLGTAVPNDVWERIQTEEELSEALNQPIAENDGADSSERDDANEFNFTSDHDT